MMNENENENTISSSLKCCANVLMLCFLYLLNCCYCSDIKCCIDVLCLYTPWMCAMGHLNKLTRIVGAHVGTSRAGWADVCRSALQAVCESVAYVRWVCLTRVTQVGGCVCVCMCVCVCVSVLLCKSYAKEDTSPNINI